MGVALRIVCVAAPAKVFRVVFVSDCCQRRDLARNLLREPRNGSEAVPDNYPNILRGTKTPYLKEVTSTVHAR